MSEQTESSEHAANSSPEHLTFIEAAARLNITADAVRMRVRRGKLTTVRVNERKFVLWPQPEQAHEPRTERVSSEHRSAVQDTSRLVTALEDRIASLERQLDERTEEIRRRDHIIAGLVERVKELPATASVSQRKTVSEVDTSQERDPSPVRGDRPHMAPELMKPVSDALVPGWRHWWRRITGSE